MTDREKLEKAYELVMEVIPNVSRNAYQLQTALSRAQYALEWAQESKAKSLSERR